MAETTPLARDITLRNGYSEGYAVSKWAGETLLHSANARFGLPVNIFRCGMILANRLHAGQINQADTLTRLLYSIARKSVVSGKSVSVRVDLGGRRLMTHKRTI